jgi:hypothetical protein
VSEKERIIIPHDELHFTYPDYHDIWNEELCLAQLLLDGAMHLNDGRNWYDDDKSVIAYVNCSDIFAWGCADSESVLQRELPGLYTMHMADPTWGTEKWCILKRNEEPEKPVLRDMKESGAWDSPTWLQMLELPKDPYKAPDVTLGPRPEHLKPNEYDRRSKLFAEAHKKGDEAVEELIRQLKAEDEDEVAQVLSIIKPTKS